MATVYNHCNCTSTAIVPYVPPCPTNCLIVTSPITLCENSPAAGGNTGSIDLGALNDLTTCSGCTPTYTLLSYDTLAFSVMTLNSTSGLLEWTTGSPANAVPGSFYQVLYKVECACLGLASQGLVSICIRDLCATTQCVDGEVCDPLTGNCVPFEDIEVA